MRFRRRTVLGGSIALGVATLSRSGRQTLAQGDGYALRDLGALTDLIERGQRQYRGFFSDINDNGEVGGGLVTSEVKTSPAVWPVGGRRVLQKSGRFGGEVHALNASGLAVGREFGDVLGIPEGQALPSAYRPAAWQDGEPIELPLPDGLSTDSASLLGIATDVNEDGLIVGTCFDLAAGQFQPVIWHDGAVETVLPTSGDNLAECINASGAVGGTATVGLEFANGTITIVAPALWTDGEIEVLEWPEDIALPESAEEFGPNLRVLGISDDGLLLVRMSTGALQEGTLVEQSYLYDRGEWTSLASPAADYPYVQASAISPSGIVVGAAMGAVEGMNLPVVWTDSSPQDISELIPDLGNLTLTGFLAVNSDGAILAVANGADGSYHGLVLTPE